MQKAVPWLVLYAVWMTLLVGGLFWGRHTALRQYAGAQARSEWEDFRQEMARIGKEGPVERRMPKSDEPPALVLMRDYFGVSLAAALIFGTLLYVMLVGAIYGAFSRDYTPKTER
jgi:hypothetical protein